MLLSPTLPNTMTDFCFLPQIPPTKLDLLALLQAINNRQINQNKSCPSTTNSYIINSRNLSQVEITMWRVQSHKNINLNIFKIMKKIILFVTFTALCTFQAFSQGIIIDHKCTSVEDIPESAIRAAKQKLHIAYGHTSHGSQLTSGMSGMVTFMNEKGYPHNLYAWNNGGSGGALDLHDYAMSGDVGYYPAWVNNTRNYLGAPDPITGRGTGANADVNVIIWSWCGQVTGKYSAGTLNSEYIDPMVQLETDYFGVKFVYMTGHLDHASDAANKAANQLIRDFCIANNKILYDFAAIESYDPDNNYFEFADDACNYYESATGKMLGNWATEWQNSHTENVDWYSCKSSHSQPLNANQKAYAAWWLWARLAGWDGITGIAYEGNLSQIISVFPNPSYGKFTVSAKGSGINSIEISNALGSRVFSISYINPLPTKQINLSDFAKGVYFIKIDSAGEIHSQKILVQ